MIRFPIFFFVLIILYPKVVTGQLNNDFFADNYTIQDDDSSRIKFGIEAFGFLKNNEFTTDIVPGYTLFGYQFKPYFSYYPSSRIRLDAGAFFLKDFGEKNFQEIRPVFVIKYQKSGFSLLFGSLEGGLSHRLIEPIYDIERVINKRIEDGVQIKYTKNKIFFDTWLEWVNMIEFGDREQEEFNAGISFNYQLIKKNNLILEIPVQLLANHLGGEIDRSPELSRTMYNAAIGFGLEFPMKNDNFLQTVRTDTYFTGYFSTDTPDTFPFRDGNGLFMNVSGTFRWFDIMISYWHGDQFYSPNGTPIYQSVSFVYNENNYTEIRRDLIFIRLLFEHNFNHGLTLAFRFEPLYDFNTNRFDHIEGLYLRYRTDFTLNRRKKP